MTESIPETLSILRYGLLFHPISQNIPTCMENKYVHDFQLVKHLNNEFAISQRHYFVFDGSPKKTSYAKLTTQYFSLDFE